MNNTFSNVEKGLLPLRMCKNKWLLFFSLAIAYCKWIYLDQTVNSIQDSCSW